MISPTMFFSFSKFRFFRLLGGAKGQKTIQNDKNLCLSRFIFQEPYIIWLSFVVHLCEMIISPSVFFIFSNLIFRVRGVKGQKMVQNDKKFYHSCPLSQEPYIIGFSFLLHLCKMIISPGKFFIFSKFSFFGLLGG